MLFEIILALLFGVIVGTFTGLFPGIHINLVGALLVSLSVSLLAQIPVIYLVTFIVAMAITHTFLDFVPSVLLGCPNTDTELSVLPGHELLKNGEGYSAIMLTAYGGLASIFLLLFVSFPLIVLAKNFYKEIIFTIPYILIFICLMLIFLEKSKFKAFLVVFLTGVLGYVVLNMNLEQSLLPLLSGLFGASNLILSIKTKTRIPEQKITKPREPLLRPLIGALIASPFCGFLPGLGSGQAAVIGSTISKSDKKGFLILLGATNTLVMGFSFLSLYAIGKTRTGAAAAIKELIGNSDTNTFLLMLAVVLISGITSFFLTKRLAKFFALNITKINYSTISYITLAVLTLVVLFVSGFLGLLILTISTLTGIYCISLKIKRTNMMGCLLIPTIILYLV